MANNRRFVVNLEIDSSTAEKQIKTTAKNIKAILTDMGNASDKMTYFKELVDYISQIDSQLNAFKKKYGDDMFNKMFGGLDSSLQKQMESLFDTTTKELTAVEELRQKITSAQKSGATKEEAKALKAEVEALYAGLGRSGDIDISNRLGPANMLKESLLALDEFAIKWKDVNNQVSAGFGLGAGPGGGISDDIQKKINELNETKKSLQQVVDAISDEKDATVEIPKEDKEQLALLEELVNKYKQAADARKAFETRKDTGSDAYKKAVAEEIIAAKQLKGAFDADPDAEIFGDKSSAYMVGKDQQDAYIEAEKYLQDFYSNQKEMLSKIESLFNSEIQGINNEIEKLMTALQDKSNVYDELYNKTKKYLDLQKQLANDNISDEDYSKIDNDLMALENEISTLGELEGKVKDVERVFAAFNSGDIDDNDLFDKLKNTLGVELPNAAEKAEDALQIDQSSQLDKVASGFKTITTEAQEASNEIQSVMYHLGNLLSKNGTNRDTFGDMPYNLTDAVTGTSFEKYGYGVLGGGLFGVTDPSTFDEKTVVGSKFIQSIDLSKYNMYMADTEERATALMDFLSKLQKFAMKGAEPNYKGFDEHLSGVSIDTLYQQAQTLFKQSNLTKDQFNDFVNEMTDLLKQAGLQFDANENSLDFTNVGDLGNTENISTRFMKMLGYQGVNVGTTQFDGLGQGSVLFDFNTSDIVGYFNTVKSATQDYQNIMKQIDGKEWVGTSEQLEQYKINIDEVITKLKEYRKIQLDRGFKESSSTIQQIDETLSQFEKIRNTIDSVDFGPEKQTQFARITDVDEVKKEAAAYKDVADATEKAGSALKELNTESKQSGDNAAGVNKLENELKSVENQAKQTANAVERVGDNQQKDIDDKKSYDKDQTQDVDTSAEIQQLERLEAKVKEVEAAIKAKTQAFTAEGTEVNSVVQKEIGDLEQLIAKLKEVEAKIDAIKRGLKGVDDAVDSVDKKTVQDNSIKDSSTLSDSTPDKIARDYALDSTLHTTNSILQGILTAVSRDESTGDIAKALDGAIAELKAAASAIKTNADDFKQKAKDDAKQKLEDKPKDKSDDTSKDKTKDTSKDTEKEKTFEDIKKDELSNFEKYKKDVEESIHVTDEFKGRLNKLQSELSNVGDANGLDAWKQSFEGFRTEFSRFEDASKNVLTGQINSIKKEAKDALKGIDLENTTIDEKLDPEGYKKQRAEQEKIAQGFKEIQIASDVCTSQVKSNQQAEIAALNKKKQQLLESVQAYKKEYGFLNSGGKSGKNYGNTAIIQETTRYNQFKQYADDGNTGFKDSNTFKTKLAEYTTAYNKLIAIREKLSTKTVLTDRDVQEFNDAKKAAAEYGKELDKMIAKSNKLESGQFRSSTIGSDVNVDDALSRKQALTDFVTGMHDARESTIKFSNDYQECMFKMKNSDGTWTKMTATLDKTSNKMYSTAGEITKHGTALGEFAGALKGEFLKLGRYMIASFGIEEVIQAVRTGVTYVKEIDDALTDLKKVTNETDAGYDRFLQTMSKTAGVVGSTVAELTTMAAEWARLGYSMQEAANLAESTAVLLNVSEFENATEASEALISTIQAFGYAADDSMHVVDILNEVGNNFAVSSDGIATALQDSASALMAGGNSMEEATAMIAAANKVTQDPSKVGAGLRTISLRLRGTEVSGQLEELGEDTEGLVSSSKMRDKIKGLTGVDILTDTGAYKSTYDIIREIAYVWEDMADIDQAALLELMAGKNRSNIMAALLTNVEDLEEAKEKALDAEGSAYRENEAYLDSIQGRVDLFMNALQTFWMNLISSDMAKGVVDLGTTLIQFLDTAHGKLTALGAAFAIFLKTTKNIDTFKNGLNTIFGTDFKKSKVGAAANMAASGAASAKTFMTEFSKGVNKNPTGLGISQAIAANIKDSHTKINMRDSVAKALGVKNLSEVGELTKAQQKQAASAMQAAAASSKLGTAQTATTMATAGLTSASTMATTAMNGLKSAVVAHPFIAIAAAVLVAVTALDKLIVTAQEASEASHEKFNEIADVASTTVSNIDGLNEELSNINKQITELEGKNLSFTDDQELQRLYSQKAALENNLSIQEELLKSQEKVRNEAAVTAMKDFVKASNEGAESAEKTGKAIGFIAGGLLAIAGIAAAVPTGGTSLVATGEGLSMMTAAAIVGGGAVVGASAGGEIGQSLNAATVSSYEDWYKTYTDAYKEKTQAAADAREKYEKDPGDMDKYDKWQELEQEAIDVQSKMYDNLTQMQNYYSEIEYGQSEALDRELDTWYNFLDKMNIDQNGANAKVNALDRIFGKNASDEVKAFREEIDKALDEDNTKFDIAAEIEGREDLQELENQLAEIGITTDEVSDYFRQTGEIGTQAFSDLSGEITAAETAMTKLQGALEKNTNEGYETRNTGLEEMKTLMEKGAIGSESKLWSIADAMGFTYDSAKSIEANADELYDFIKVRDDWYQVDEDGTWGVSGADAFAEDIEKAVANSKELQDLKVKWNFDEATGTLDFDFNNMKFDEIVAALGKTKEAAGLTNEEFIDMLTHLGQFYDVQWTSGNDIVSYLEYLGTTSLDAKSKLEAVKDPLEQLLRKQNLNPKQIEAYLTGDGSLKKLPEDLQAAVGAYRTLRDEMEKPVKTPEATKVTKTEKEGGFFSKVKDFFSGDKSKETVEKNVDVEVKADEVDTTNVDEKAKDAIQKAESNEVPTVDKTVELEASLEDITESIQSIEDKDITIDVTVKGLKDVEKLNKNLDLDSKVKGNVNKLSEYVEGAKALSKLDNNITSEVVANVEGNVTDEFEFKLNNLEVFADSAKGLKDVGSITSEVTANVHGNVTETAEFKLNNLQTYSESAVDVEKIGHVSSSVIADVGGNVTEKAEFKLNNLEVFTDSAKDIEDIGSVTSMVTANVDGNVINTEEFRLNNLKTFTESAQGIESVGENVKATITADIQGNVKDTFEFSIDNLKTFTESAKDIKGVGTNTKAKITADIEGNVKDTFEFSIDNLKVFTDSAKDIKKTGTVESKVTADLEGNVKDLFEEQIDNLQVFTNSAEGIRDVGKEVQARIVADIDGNVKNLLEEQIDNLQVFVDNAQDIKSVGEHTRATVTADLEGNVKDTFEFSIDNLKTFVDSAKDIKDVGENTRAKVTADIDGNVVNDFEYRIDNLKAFTDSAVDIKNVGENTKAIVTANIDGNVKDLFEYQIDNLKAFTDSAAGINKIDKNTKAKVIANVEGNVIDTFEYKIDNLKEFVNSAQGIKKIGPDTEAKITANIDGNVTDIFEYQIDNLKAFVDNATGIKNIGKNTEAKITANLEGNVKDIFEYQIDNLKAFVNSATNVASIGTDVKAKVTANVDGTVIDTPEYMINNLKVFADSAKDVEAIGEVSSTVTADVAGTVLSTPEAWINNLKTFYNSAKDLKDIESFAVRVTADIDGNVISTPEAWINNLETFYDGVKDLKGIDSFAVKVTANIDGNVYQTREGKINNLGEFAYHAEKLNDIKSFTTEVTANIGGNITDEEITKLERFGNLIAELSPTPLVTVSVTANVATDAINSAITLLTNLSNSGVFHDYNATVTVTANTEQVTSAIQNVNSAILNEKIVEISETGSKIVLSALDSINNKKLNNKTVKVNYQTGTLPTIPNWPGGRDGDTSSPWPLANGTAHAKGTAWAGGTAYKGGNWGAPMTSRALVGELGPEIVVRGSRWFTVGDNGAEFANIQKGDIVFNHKQTEQLLSNGYVTSRGKAHAQGTALAEGTAYAKGGSKRKTYTFSYDSSSGSVKKTSSTKKANKKKKTKDYSADFEEVFDWFEVKIEEINEDLDLMAAKLENAISIQGKNNILDSMIKTNKSQLVTLQKGYNLYSSYANNLLKKIPKKFRDEAKNGKIALEEFAGKADEQTLEAIKNYREWAQKAADVKKQIQEIRREITELAKQKFDNISEKYDNIESLQTNREQHYIDMADYREDKGYINSGEYYEAAMAEVRKQRNSNINEKKKLQASLDASVKKGDIKKYSAEWYDMVNAIHEVDAAIDENNATIEDYQNRINEIHFDNFEKGLYRISRIADETQGIIDLIADKDVVETNDLGNVEWTDGGITQLGLYAQMMENYKQQSELYAKEIDEVNKMYDNGQMSYQEYIEKLTELRNGQHEAIQGYEDSKEAIVDLQKTRVDAIKEGIEKEIDAYSELIDKKKEELDAEKDLYDFQKSVIEQKKSVSDIERQLAALSGDNSASARAQRKKLEAELAQAQQDLQDSYYDRSVTKQQEALDNELEQFTELREKEMEGWDKWLENVDLVFADAVETVQSSGTVIKDTLGAIANEWDLEIQKHIHQPWKDASTAIQDTADRLDEVTAKFNELVDSVDAHAESQIETQKDQNADITDEKKDKFQKGEKAYVKKGTQAYDSKGKKDFKVGYNTSYTVISTDNATGMTKVKNSKGEIRYFKTSDLSEKAFSSGGGKTGGSSSGSSSGSTKYYKKYTGKSGSIVDALKAIGVSNTFANRKKIAKANGISSYSGTAKQNTKLLDLLKKGKLKKYAVGSLKIDKDQLALLDELGEELQIVPDGNGRLDYVKKGTGIIPADLTSNLMKWGELNPQDILDRNRPSIGASPEIHATEINLNIQYGDMLRIDNFKGDNPDEIAKIVAKQFEKHTKDLNSALRKYVR